jgi:hypothetical protein
MVVRETLGNAAATVGDIELTDLLPPSIASLLIWMRDTIPRGLGFASRTGHITGTVSLAAVMVIASATLLTVVAVVYLAIALPIALLRLVPPVERRWPWGTADWPFWTVKSKGFQG